MMIILLMWANVSLAGNGRLSGYVRDAVTKAPIPDANIIIQETSLGAASQANGYFVIENIPEGTYEVTVKVIGYEEYTIVDVSITGDSELNALLVPTAIMADPVIVTATRYNHRQSQVTVASTIVNAAEISESAGTTIGEVLEASEGVYFNSYDGIAGNQIPSIRGAGVDQVVVLLDGVRLNTAQGGGIDLNLFPTTMIEKVEVVRGGHSALIGSDAVGGAIQLFSTSTIPDRGYGVGFQSTVGSFGLQELHLNVAQKISKLSYVVALGRMESDGDFEYKPDYANEKLVRKNNDYRGDNVFVKANYSVNTKYELGVLAHAANVEKGVAGSTKLGWDGQPMLSEQARAKVERILYAITGRGQVRQNVHVQAQLFMQRFTYGYKNPAGWVPDDDEHKNKAMGLDLTTLMYIRPFFSFSAGVELRQDQLNSTQIVDAKDRNTIGMFVQTESKVNTRIGGRNVNFTLVQAIRRDDISEIGGQTSPKIGFLLQTGSAFQVGVRGNWGMSFRAPGFNDLFWPADQWTKGNPDLVPESGTNMDVGLECRSENLPLRADVTLFRRNVENLIQWNMDVNSGIWMPMNIGKAKVKGLEASLDYTLPGNFVFLKMAHTYMKATDESDAYAGKRLTYRPDSKTDLQVGVKFHDLTARLGYQVVSERFSDRLNSNSLPSYHLVNATVNYKLHLFGSQNMLKFQVLNLTDKMIFINDGYPSPGQEFRVSLGINY